LKSLRNVLIIKLYWKAEKSDCCTKWGRENVLGKRVWLKGREAQRDKRV